MNEVQQLAEELAQIGILKHCKDTEEVQDISRTVYLWKQGMQTWSQDDFYQSMFQIVAIPSLADETTFEGCQRPLSAVVVGDIKQSNIVSYLTTKMGAFLFDLSPKTLEMAKEEYEQDPNQVVIKTFTCARSCGVSLIVIREMEQIFAKKSNSTEFDPKTIKKDLTKQMKTLRPVDKVFVLGLLVNPLDVPDPTTLSGNFDIFLFKPIPGYGDRRSYFQTHLPESLISNRKEIASVLASMSEYGNSDSLNELTEKFSKNKMKFGYGSVEITSNLDNILDYKSDDALEVNFNYLAAIANQRPG